MLSTSLDMADCKLTDFLKKSVNIPNDMGVLLNFGCGFYITHDFVQFKTLYSEINFAGARGDKLEYLQGAVFSQPGACVELSGIIM